MLTFSALICSMTTVPMLVLSPCSTGSPAGMKALRNVSVEVVRCSCLTADVGHVLRRRRCTSRSVWSAATSSARTAPSAVWAKGTRWGPCAPSWTMWTARRPAPSAALWESSIAPSSSRRPRNSSRRGAAQRCSLQERLCVSHAMSRWLGTSRKQHKGTISLTHCTDHCFAGARVSEKPQDTVHVSRTAGLQSSAWLDSLGLRDWQQGTNWLGQLHAQS